MSVVAKLKQVTASSSYTAVADDLVRDAFQRLRNDGKPFSEPEVDKNIRRRVYDTLNVLASMGFVARSGKDVEWKGIAGFMRNIGLRIPNASDPAMQCNCHLNGTANVNSSARLGEGMFADECGRSSSTEIVHTCNLGPVERSKLENERMRKRIAEKKTRVCELRNQEAHLQQIVTRNASRDSARIRTGFDVLVSDDLEYVRPDANRVDLPFVMISTDSKTSIELEMEDQRDEVAFRFDGPFKIHEGYSIVGQVCQQETRERETKLAVAKLKEENETREREANMGSVNMKEENEMMVGKNEFWSTSYGGMELETSPVTEATSASPCDVGKFAEFSFPPIGGGAVKRRTPPCFALHRPDFLR